MGKSNEQTEHKKKEVLDALEKTLGIVTTACKMVGIGRTQFYEWLKTDPEFREQVEDIQNITLDFVESKLHGQIKQENTTAIIFYLKTRGKQRGYVERQEVTGADGMPNNFTIEIIDKAEDTDE